MGNITSRKKHRAQLWNAQLALDDYGTGFNSEAVLMEYAPDLVKVDVSIIRGIDADPDRRDLLNSLIGYAGTRNIRVLAEGVETAAELETVIACGVDYIQGYYIARPGDGDPGVGAGLLSGVHLLCGALAVGTVGAVRIIDDIRPGIDCVGGIGGGRRSIHLDAAVGERDEHLAAAGGGRAGGHAGTEQQGCGQKKRKQLFTHKKSHPNLL